MIMKKIFFALIICLPTLVFAQNSITQEGEFGVGIGAAHYFGDLNTRAHFDWLFRWLRPIPSWHKQATYLSLQ